MNLHDSPHVLSGMDSIGLDVEMGIAKSAKDIKSSSIVLEAGASVGAAIGSGIGSIGSTWRLAAPGSMSDALLIN